jgi:hypothetical protein
MNLQDMKDLDAEKKLQEQREELERTFFEKWGTRIGDIVSLKYDELYQFKSSEQAKIAEIVSAELVRLVFKSGGGGTWHIQNLNTEGETVK